MSNTPIDFNGIHVHAVEDFAADEAGQPDYNNCRLTVRVFPLPAGVAEPLSKHVQAAIREWMIVHKHAGEGMTDLTAKGPMQ